MNKNEIKGPHATEAHKAQIILSSHTTGLRLQKSSRANLELSGKRVAWKLPVE